MSCIHNCKLCDNFILTQSIAFTSGNLVVDLPNMSFINGKKYCIVFAQTLPATATIDAPVVFTIGGGTTQYPFNNRCCVAITASQIHTRQIYPAIVNTAITNTTGTGAFIYVGCKKLPQTDVVPATVLPSNTTA